MKAENPLFTTAEAAAYLDITRSYLYKLMMRRKVPYYKPRGKLPARIKSYYAQLLLRIPQDLREELNRDKDEDDLRRARRCADAATKKLGKQPKSGLRR